MTVLRNKTELKPLRKTLRRKTTNAERKVWNIIRNRQINKLKFFRQYSIGRYILDFYCPQIKLAIEIDGGQHNEMVNIKKDAERTRILENKGIRVIRFWNNDVLQNTEGVYEEILKNNH